MYTPTGFGFSEVGDVEIFPHGDELHLFHLTLPNHDTIQHVVSTNGLDWMRLPDALRTSDPGACDDDQLWTMSVSEHDGTFHMLYTALARAEGGRHQRTGHATSTDLVRWEKDAANPVAAPDPRWYETDIATTSMVSWRDPKPVQVNGVWHVAVNARENHGPHLRRGCVGHFTTHDFKDWEIHPPLFAPGRFWDIECPQVFSVDGTWYLTAGIMEERTQRYWIGESHLGPWRQPPGGGVLAPIGHYAGRVAHWNGTPIYMCWHLPHGGTADWASPTNLAGKFVVAPLALRKRDDGSLACVSFDRWHDLATGSAQSLAAPSVSQFRAASVEAWQLDTAPGELDLIAVDPGHDAYVLTGDLVLNAPAGGLGFRLDGDSGAGYFIELEEGTDRVSLQRWLPTTDARSGRSWFSWTELQRGRLRQACAPGATMYLQLILNGPYIEVSLDGDVVIAALSGARLAGPVGVWAESGSVTLRNHAITPLRLPSHR